jgi:hypothetical protein
MCIVEVKDNISFQEKYDSRTKSFERALRKESKLVKVGAVFVGAAMGNSA